jgi:hypothetical protein
MALTIQKLGSSAFSNSKARVKLFQTEKVPKECPNTENPVLGTPTLE